MKTLKKVLFIGLMAFIVCLARTVQAQELYKNEKAPIHERIMDLLSRLTVEEKISLLRATSPGISRLDIPKYYHGNEALHGVVRPGRFTVFPQAIGLAATWNPVLQNKWLLLFLMRRVPVGMNWIKDVNKIVSSVIYSLSGLLR